MPRHQDLDDATDEDDLTDPSALIWRARLLGLVDLALEARLRYEIAEPAVAADRLELLSSRAGQLAARLRSELAAGNPPRGCRPGRRVANSSPGIGAAEDGRAAAAPQVAPLMS